jgi:hypothetical protein
MVVFIAVADDVSETQNPSIVQDVHLFLITREVRVMGSHLIIPLMKNFTGPVAGFLTIAGSFIEHSK